MLKAIGALQMVLAPALVLPAFTGQQEGTGGIEAQLQATKQSIDYLRGLEANLRSGDAAALRALDRSTEPARDASPQRAAHLQAIQDDMAQLRFNLDRLLADPAEVEAIMSMPPSVVRALGLGGGAPAAAPIDPEAFGAIQEPNMAAATTPAGVGAAPTTGVPNGGMEMPAAQGAGAQNPGTQGQGVAGQMSTSPMTGMTAPSGGTSLPMDPSTTAGATGMDQMSKPAQDTTSTTFQAPLTPSPLGLVGTGSTTGLSDAARAAIRGDLGPLGTVSDSSRRRGGEPVALEGEEYVADPVALGRLLVRSKRSAEAIELLEQFPKEFGARYWLARAYQQRERDTEAIEILRALSEDEDAGMHGRHAKQDLEFLEFKNALKKRRR